MTQDEKQKLEREHLSLRHKLKNVDSQGLSPEDKDKLREQIHLGLRNVEEKLAKG